MDTGTGILIGLILVAPIYISALIKTIEYLMKIGMNLKDKVYYELEENFNTLWGVFGISITPIPVFLWIEGDSGFALAIVVIYLIVYYALRGLIRKM